MHVHVCVYMYMCTHIHTHICLLTSILSISKLFACNWCCTEVKCAEGGPFSSITVLKSSFVACISTSQSQTSLRAAGRCWYYQSLCGETSKFCGWLKAAINCHYRRIPVCCLSSSQCYWCFSAFTDTLLIPRTQNICQVYRSVWPFIGWVKEEKNIYQKKKKCKNCTIIWEIFMLK